MYFSIEDVGSPWASVAEGVYRSFSAQGGTLRFARTPEPSGYSPAYLLWDEGNGDIRWEYTQPGWYTLPQLPDDSLPMMVRTR